MKSKSGLERIFRACVYTRDGLITAVKNEAAFRQELCVVAPLFAVSFFLPVSFLEWGFLTVSLLFVLCVELLNSAIEATVDLATEKWHPLAKRAKDLGSAAVSFAIFSALLVWAAILLSVFC